MGGDDETRFVNEIKGEQVACELANGKSILNPIRSHEIEHLQCERGYRHDTS